MRCPWVHDDDILAYTPQLGTGRPFRDLLGTWSGLVAWRTMYRLIGTDTEPQRRWLTSSLRGGKAHPRSPHHHRGDDGWTTTYEPARQGQ